MRKSHTRFIRLCHTPRSPARRGVTGLASLLQQQARGLANQATQPAVFVNKDTKVICQGLTGKNGTFHTEQVRWCASTCASIWLQTSAFRLVPGCRREALSPRRPSSMARRWWAA